MRCISPLDNSHCRLDSACIHSCHSYDWTTHCLGPYLQQHAGYFLSVPNEMHLSTRQFSLSTRQCLYPLVRLVPLVLVPLAWAPTYNNMLDIFLVSLMICIFPLDNIRCRLDNACVHSYDSYNSYDWTTDCLGPNLGHHA